MLPSVAGNSRIACVDAVSAVSNDPDRTRSVPAQAEGFRRVRGGQSSPIAAAAPATLRPESACLEAVHSGRSERCLPRWSLAHLRALPQRSDRLPWPSYGLSSLRTGALFALASCRHLVADLDVSGTAQEVHDAVRRRDRVSVSALIGDCEDAWRVLNEVVSTERLVAPMD